MSKSYDAKYYLIARPRDNVAVIEFRVLEAGKHNVITPSGKMGVEIGSDKITFALNLTTRRPDTDAKIKINGCTLSSYFQPGSYSGTLVSIGIKPPRLPEYRDTWVALEVESVHAPNVVIYIEVRNADPVVVNLLD